MLILSKVHPMFLVVSITCFVVTGTFESDQQCSHEEKKTATIRQREDVHNRQRKGRATPSLLNASSGWIWKLEREVRAGTTPIHGLR